MSMRKTILVTLIISCGAAFLLVGSAFFKKEKPAIIIGDIHITKHEFEEALSTASFLPVDEEFRKEFLDKFINRKLILYEAERKGLHKNPEFLQEVQQFWEQTLLNAALSKKINELAPDNRVSDREIRKYYNKNRYVLFSDKELSDVYDQIRWSLLNEKQRSMIDEWGKALKINVKVTIDHARLGIKTN